MNLEQSFLIQESLRVVVFVIPSIYCPKSSHIVDKFLKKKIHFLKNKNYILYCAIQSNKKIILW